MTTRAISTFNKRFKPVWKDKEASEPAPLPEKEKLTGRDFDHIWTIVDPNVPSGMQYLIPGMHFVNMVDFVWCEVPFTNEDLVDEYCRW